MKRIKKTLTLVSMAVLLLTACEAPKELGVVPYPQYAQTTSKTVELPSTVTFLSAGLCHPHEACRQEPFCNDRNNGRNG